MNAVLKLYRLALRLYPSAFRERYAGEMLGTARRLASDAPSKLRFAAALYWDTLRSLLREHARAAIPSDRRVIRSLAPFFVTYTIVLFVISLSVQQFLRRGADRQPESLVSLVQARPQSDAVSAALAGPRLDLASRDWLHSSTPFVALYDAAGNGVAGNAVLHGALPHPPRGIFNTIRERGDYKVTWQPQPGIRIALTGRQLSGGGFVLAGQSLLHSESLNSYASGGLLIAWICQLLGCVLFLRHPDRRRIL